MLVIRDAQLERMEDSFRAEARKRALKSLLADGAFATASGGRVGLEILLEAADRNIVGYGGDPARDLERYVRLMARLGADFASASPWKERVFDDPGFPAISKLDAVETYIRVERGGR